jgi:N-acetylmuramate 1-kinase
MSTTDPHSPADLNSFQALYDLGWHDSERARLCHEWLRPLAQVHGLQLQTVRMASADASFRRYFRVNGVDHTFILMDAPPDKENCQPFVDIAKLMLRAGLRAPRVLDWHASAGFMLLEDLGQHTMMQSLVQSNASQRLDLFEQATDALLLWQQATQPNVLPTYDEALLRRELALFEQWYVNTYRQYTLNPQQSADLARVYDRLVQNNLTAPRVFVHRDFMPRNLMVPDDGADHRLGVLDFQDAVEGPLTYDIASLLRDAFISWDEDFCLDITVRYWQKAKALGLMDFEDWHSDFGAFYRSVEWMGLQRHLKVAGIFARLSLRDHKPKYLADTPRFIQYIRATASRYRELTPLLRLLDQIEGHTPNVSYAFGRV